MGQGCCLRPAKLHPLPEVIVTNARLVAPKGHQTGSSSSADPQTVKLGVLDHVTAPSMASFELEINELI